MYSDKKHLKKSNIVVYVIMTILIIVSLFLNKNYSTTKNILSNFITPSIMIVFGLSEQNMSKIYKIILLLLGSIWFAYMALHYIIGFHNPYWGN